MSEPQAYLNGQWIAASQATLPVYDAGFLMGTAVAEQLRTFNGRLFRLEPHMDRLLHSLSIVGVSLESGGAELTEIAQRLVAHNHRLLAEGDDLVLVIFVTPGPSPTMVPSGERRPTLCLHTYPLPFRLWANKYTQGESLATTDFVQVSSRSWPPELKCRSRMHYHLADQQARSRYPGSRALMLDEQGFVTEASTANLLLYFSDQGLVAPPHNRVLPGISLSVIAELAKQLGIPLAERPLAPNDVLAADEAMLTSTSPCVVPVVRLNGQPIGDGAPGAIYKRMLAAWSEAVGLDIAGQATRFAAR